MRKRILILTLHIYRIHATVRQLPAARAMKVEAALNIQGHRLWRIPAAWRLVLRKAAHRLRLRRGKRAAVAASQVLLDVHEEVPLIHAASQVRLDVHEEVPLMHAAAYFTSRHALEIEAPSNSARRRRGAPPAAGQGVASIRAAALWRRRGRG